MAATTQTHRILGQIARSFCSSGFLSSKNPSPNSSALKCFRLPSQCHQLTSAMSTLTITPHTCVTMATHKVRKPEVSTNSFHTSAPSCGLEEFFDNKEVWAEATVNTGRPYRIDELRIKSNQDLHKLWYVLLKERNMLLTMEAEYKRRCELFPSPERIAKVEESMENILEVVQERDEAVNLLETGKPSPHPRGGVVRDFLGRPVYRRFQEYAIPPHMNKTYRLLYPLGGLRRQHLKYLPLWREKLARRQWYNYHKQRRLQREALRRFPHLEGKLEEVEPPQEPRVY